MSELVEYVNPNSHVIQLSTPDNKIIKIPPKSKIILSKWYINYCPKYLRVVRIINNDALVPHINPHVKTSNINIKKTNVIKPKVSLSIKKPQKKSNIINKTKPKQVLINSKRTQNNVVERHTTNSTPTTTKPPSSPKIRYKSSKKNYKKIVGRQTALVNANKELTEAIYNNNYRISNNIGVGILSYNRLESLVRLISSIRKHTDLNSTTIFVSDESTDQNVKRWLSDQKDITVLQNNKRLGIAGNTNRLLKCLSRFKYGFILNDDVEILRPGWENFYVNAHLATNIHHFCYRQIGVYGAKSPSNIRSIGGYNVSTIYDKPHGAILFFTNDLFQKIGYFNEEFGIYGMEHVDWSTRASNTDLVPNGYHDIINSNLYFKIHQEKSAVENRTQHLQKSRVHYEQIKNNGELYTNASNNSDVPSLSVIIPIRNIDRSDALTTIVNNIRAQQFPNIEIIVSEQDIYTNIDIDTLYPLSYYFVKSDNANKPFNKSKAFNTGVFKAKYDKIVLHDADLLCQSKYLQNIFTLFKSHDAMHIGSRVLYLSQKSTTDVIYEKQLTNKLDCERIVIYFEGGSLACTKQAYIECGGFNETFEGYGIEDCDFFNRLKHKSNRFCDTRTEDFIHLYHSRTSDWQICHKNNKNIYNKIMQQPINNYIADQKSILLNTYKNVY